MPEGAARRLVDLDQGEGRAGHDQVGIARCGAQDGAGKRRLADAELALQSDDIAALRAGAPSVAPSCSVAVSSGRDIEKAGIFRCRLLACALWARCGRLVAVEVALERAGLRHADILGLVGAQLGELGADLLEVQRRHLLVERLGQRVDLLLVLARIGAQISIWASVWLENEADITKLGWPVALPRFTRRPSDSTMMRLPSGNSTSSTCGLTLCHLKFRRLAIWISLSKWPMLQTMARCFIALHVVDA